MKSKLVTFCFTLFVSLFSFVTFAQEDPPADDDPPTAPINSKLIWLALLGIAFMIFYFKNKYQNIQK